MIEKNDFALVPRPTSSLEKAEPGAKRILSNMVADTLSLAKKGPPRSQGPLRIVVLDDEEGARECYSLVLKWLYDGVEILKFGDARATWEELSHTDPDLFITDIHHVGMSCPEMLARLAERRIKYPVLVISAGLSLYDNDSRRGWGPGLNVSFLGKPWDLETLRTAVEAALQIPARLAP
jgi:DNA-binding NtrC family response regulator